MTPRGKLNPDHADKFVWEDGDVVIVPSGVTNMNPLFPDVTVQLAGEDGNVFAIIGRVSAAMKRAGHRDEARAFQHAALDCGSYDEVLRLVMNTVEVGDEDEDDD